MRESGQRDWLTAYWDCHQMTVSHGHHPKSMPRPQVHLSSACAVGPRIFHDCFLIGLVDCRDHSIHGNSGFPLLGVSAQLDRRPCVSDKHANSNQFRHWIGGSLDSLRFDSELHVDDQRRLVSNFGTALKIVGPRTTNIIPAILFRIF